MLEVSGKSSLTDKKERDDSHSSCISTSTNSTSDGITKKDKRDNAFSSYLSNRERVKRLIDCMKKKQESKTTADKSEENSLKNVGTSFQNRFLAQKNIIDMQRSKLIEQEKIINELKMGIISNEDFEKNDKYDIKELFKDCRLRLLGKVPLDYLPKKEDFLVKTKTAPKIIQELEKRALERMQYREIIKERRKQLEETKKQLQEESLKRKHQMEEEDRLKHLEMLNERHKKEQERMRIRHINKEIFLRNWNKAVLFQEKKVLRKSFYFLRSEYESSLDKFRTSEEFYNKKILNKYFTKLFSIINSRNMMKCEIADNFQRHILLKRSWRSLKENYMNGIRSWQVAEDFNDFRIERKFFKCFHGFACKEGILREIKYQQACYHYDRKILFYSFFHWKSLPLVLKMEKVKEERKEKWRKKVLEILPDFCPPET